MARCWPLLWVLCGLAWLAPPGLPAFLQAHSRRHRLKVSKSALKDAGRDKDALSESLTSRSELGKDSEQLLRSFPQLEEQCGPYVISSQAPVLVASTRNLSNEVLAELRNGQVVQIQELSRLEQRLRGRLKEESDDPRWISLKNTQTGFRWACPKGALDEIEGKLQKLEAQVKEEKERTSDLPGEEESEMDTLVDLLYLKALFAQTAAGLPPLSSFERSRGTWAMFGRGLDNWNAVAGKQGFEVPLVVVSGQLRREILRSLDRKRYCQSLVDAYTQEQLRSPGQFQGFLEGFREAKNRVLKEIGGASGLPSLKSAPQTASAWTEQDFGKWIGVFRDVTTSTRCFQADLYFGHALFGLSLRRLCRRFELELSTQSFFTSEQTSESEEVLVERFKNFVEMLAKNQLLGEVLSLSPNLIAAIRRQTKAIFGKGLRDELQQPIERASKEIEENPDDVPPIAKHTSFLLEAAERGELRMLSVSLEGKERILMDALTFGVFLQDADDESVRRLVASDD